MLTTTQEPISVNESSTNICEKIAEGSAVICNLINHFFPKAIDSNVLQACAGSHDCIRLALTAAHCLGASNLKTLSVSAIANFESNKQPVANMLWEVSFD